jgi:hypothetical protein
MDARSRAKERFKLFDVVTATDISIQTAHVNGFDCPPTDELTVLGFNGERLILSDGSSCWHHSHFYKVGERGDLQDEIRGRHIDFIIFDELAELETPADPAAMLDFQGDFDEQEYVKELADYIAKTYGEHYAKEGVQTFSLIVKRPLRGLHFALSNVIKYADRFGEKDGFNRKDLLKVAHYAILALAAFDRLEAQHAQA